MNPDDALQPYELEDFVLINLRQYLKSRNIREKSETVEKTLKERLMEAVAILPDDMVEVDDNGSIFFTPEDGIEEGDRRIKGFKRERRVSRVLDPDKVDLMIDSLGMDREEVYTTEVIPEHTETFLDEDKLFMLNFSGKLGDEELNAMYNEKVSYAFVLVK